jgi:hypothetical protein
MSKKEKGASGTGRDSGRDTRRDTSQQRHPKSLTRGERSTYTGEETERALRHVAVCSGNVMRAQRELAEQGLDIPYGTLRDWVRNIHVGRYLEIEQEELPRLWAQIAAQSEELALREGEFEAEVLERLRAELPNLPARDVSTTMRNLSVSRGINVDKAAMIRGKDQPKESNPVKDFAEGIAALQEMGLIERGERGAKQVANLEEIEIVANERELSGRDEQDEEPEG